MTLANEDRVIRRCQQGDIDAFETIFHHYKKPLLALAYRMLDNRDDAEDAMQDAFIKLHRHVGRYRFDAAFSTWIYRITANVCYDKLRKRRRSAEADLEHSPETPDRPVSDLRLHLQQAIAALPPQAKVCFVLFAQEGFKQREVAEMLGLREGTVKRYVFEAKTRLRNALSGSLREWQTDDV